MNWLNFGVAVLGGLAMAGASADPGVLEGRWGGERLRLVVDAAGATVDTDCANGRIAGPIKLSAAGRFSAIGTFEQHQAGPQRADAPASPPDARYSGQVEGDEMTLSIVPGGSTTVQTFRVRKGAAVKLVRCL